MDEFHFHTFYTEPASKNSDHTHKYSRAFPNSSKVLLKEITFKRISLQIHCTPETIHISELFWNEILCGYILNESPYIGFFIYTLLCSFYTSIFLYTYIFIFCRVGKSSPYTKTHIKCLTLLLSLIFPGIATERRSTWTAPTTKAAPASSTRSSYWTPTRPTTRTTTPSVWRTMWAAAPPTRVFTSMCYVNISTSNLYLNWTYF